MAEIAEIAEIQDSFNLRLALVGRGSMDAHITRRGPSLRLIISYLSDAPRDLAEAVLSLLPSPVSLSPGKDVARCHWQDEPGEWRWILRRTGNGEHVHVQVLEFDEEFSSLPDERGRLVFQAHCSLLRLATEVHGQLQQLLGEFGEQGYEAKWGHPFPVQALQQLEAVLQEHKPNLRKGVKAASRP